MARFVSHPLGVDLRRVCITFKPASILMTANIQRFTGGVQNGNAGLYFDAPRCLGLQLLTAFPAETTSKHSADYRCIGSVGFRSSQRLSARFTNASARHRAYIDRMSRSACLFLYDHGIFMTVA